MNDVLLWDGGLVRVRLETTSYGETPSRNYFTCNPEVTLIKHD